MTFDVEIVNRRNDPGQAGEYVGRPSPLGNPLPLKSERDRDRACDYYEKWFASRVASGDRHVLGEIKRLLEILRGRGHLTLLCWCAPARCHAETIRRWLLDHVEQGET